MEEDPHSDSWTTVDRKTSKKKNSKAEVEAPGSGWNQVAKDRRRKDSGGRRPDRSNDRRGDRRDRGKPPPRGGSTHRNTLPRKQSQKDSGSGWAPQKSTPPPASSQFSSYSEQRHKGGVPDSTEKSTVKTLESDNTRKSSWARLVSKPDHSKSALVQPVQSSSTVAVETASSSDAKPVSSVETVLPPAVPKEETAVLNVATEVSLPADEASNESVGCETKQTIPDTNQVPSEDSVLKDEDQMIEQLPINPNMELDGPKSVEDIPTSPGNEATDPSNLVESTEICKSAQSFNAESEETENNRVVANLNIDSNGNNVVLDKNKNETGSDKTESSIEQLGSTNSETRHYNRDVLLQLQKHPLSLQKPDKLPELEIVLDSPMRSSSSAPLLGETPSQYVHTFSRGGMPTKRDSRRKEVKKIISLSREPVKLHKADNAWTPGLKASGDKDSEMDVLLKKVRAILNKLTPQKFSTLVVQFKELQIDSEQKLVILYGVSL